MPRRVTERVSFADVVKQGRLPALCALRDELVRAMSGDVKPSDVAALAGRLVVVLEQIDALEKAQATRGSKVDELAGRRKARRADAKGVGGPGGDRVDGGAGGV